MYLVYLYFESSETIVPLTIASSEELCSEYIKKRREIHGHGKTSVYRIMKLSEYIGGDI